MRALSYPGAALSEATSSIPAIRGAAFRVVAPLGDGCFDELPTDGVDATANPWDAAAQGNTK